MTIFMIFLLFILGFIILKIIKNGGFIFIGLLILFLILWYAELRWYFTIEANIVVVIVLIILSYLVSMISQKAKKEIKKAEIRKKIQEEETKTKNISDKRNELLIRIQDDNDDKAKIELGKIYVEKFFNLPEKDKNSEKLLEQAFGLFDFLIKKGNVNGFIYKGMTLEKIGKEKEKFGDEIYNIENIYYDAANAYIETNIDDYIYKAGEIYWKLYNELGYSQYLKSAKKSYEKISSRDERAKRRLGEIFLVEKSM